jgi:uncharacterized protein with HEPN domain
MPPDPVDAAFLWDMLDATRSVRTLIAGMTFAQYAADRRTYRAVERELEIIGEAARNLSPSLREAHADVPWARIMAQRHVLAHEYGGIRQDLLWKVITESVPELITRLEKLLPPPPPAPEPGA